MKPTTLLTSALLVALAAPPALRADPAEHFEGRVRPLLVARCFGCHSQQANKDKGGLRLDSRDALLKGGESGPALVPGKPEESLIVRAAKRKDEEVSAMPPDGEPLTAAQVADLEKWVAEGAVFPGGAKAKADPKTHWAFQPVKPYPVPALKQGGWARTDVDRFLLAKMEAANLAPNADARTEVVARRLSFVLTGLPPTPDEARAFGREYAIDADKAVAGYADRLLASPHFGERWARHWMDAVRYADSTGHEYDYEIQGAWRYRDYLVRALNADLPFDRFVREHLAGDRLAPRVVGGRNEALLATGWWNLGLAATGPVDLAADEAERMDDRLDVLGKAFTGLTVACARCHDHKFDPIPTRDYYGLFGVAASTPAYRAWANGPALDAAADRLRGLRDRADASAKPGERIAATPIAFRPEAKWVDFADGLPTGWVIDGHAERVTPEAAVRRGVPPGLWSGTLSARLPANVRSPQFTVEKPWLSVLVAGSHSTVRVSVGNIQMLRDPIYNDLNKPIKEAKWHWVRFNLGRWVGSRAQVELTTGTVDGHHQILRTSDHADARFGIRAVVWDDDEIPDAPAWRDFRPVKRSPEYAEAEKTVPAPERFLAVYDAGGRDAPVYGRGDSAKPKGDPVPRKSPWAWLDNRTRYSNGDRRELADAVLSPTNPLTARVAVNRLWHHVYGRGIVPTVENFGLLGDAPSHPELLDVLAARFAGHQRWSVKAALREMVTSRAFRTASGAAPQADAENRLLTGYPLRRLDAEAVRDAVLSAAGTLDRTLGGPPVMVPHNLAASGSDSGNNIPESGPADGDRRRGIYLVVMRNIPSQFLEAFDRPPPQSPVGRRNVTVSPAQALALLNDPFAGGQAAAWAKRVRDGGKPAPEAIDDMFRAAFARPPSAAEAARALKAVSEPEGWEDLALSLFNAKEFIYVP